MTKNEDMAGVTPESGSGMTGKDRNPPRVTVPDMGPPWPRPVDPVFVQLAEYEYENSDSVTVIARVAKPPGSE